MAGCVAAKKIGKHAESFAARYGQKDAKSRTIRVRANCSFRLDSLLARAAPGVGSTWSPRNKGPGGFCRFP